MAKEYLQSNGRLLMTSDGELVQVPDSENLNDLADTNSVMATQSEEVTNEIEDLIVNGVIDGSPRGVYANLSALQTAYPSGANGVYLTSDNGHWYYWNGSTWTDGGVYQGIEVADGSITPKKTSFLKNQESDNIFVYQDIEENTLNGITYKVENGIIYLNGTATSNFELSFRIENVLVVGNTYSFDMFTREPSLDPATHMTRLYYGASDYIDDYMPQRTFVANATVLAITTYVFNGQTVNNLQIKPFVVSGSERPQYYFNSDVYKPINSFNGGKSLIVVAKDGTGDYSTIQEAVDNAGDTPNSPVTIYLKPGIYDEVIWLREKRNLSFIGTNKEKCIWINKTGVYANCPLYINGDFVLENITFKMTLENKGDWTPTYDTNNHDTTYPGYALHIDWYSKNPEIEQTGRITNCVFYSEAYQAVGIGLHKNQTLIFDNCEFVRNVTDDAFKDDFVGAFLCHCSQEAYETNQNLIMKNCVCKSNYGESAYFMFNLTAGNYLTFTAINNTFYSDTLGKVVKYQKGSSILSPLSHGNNIDELNN